MSKIQTYISLILPDKRSFCICVVWALFSFAAYSQTLTDKDIAYFKNYEDSLCYFQKKVFTAKTDTSKFKANIKFLKIWDEVLLNNLSFYYPFDSMKQVSRLVSADKKVRVITWNLEKADGTFYYFGFVQAMHPKTKHYEVYELADKSATIKSPENYVGDNNKWFGMLYYDIIENGDYYTLLAWDGNDKTVTRKFIDILSFKNDGSPVFGKDVFKMPKKNPKRVMFEYSSKVVMSLRYYNGAIVFDHLAAKDENNEGMAQFYGPDFSYDAFFPGRGRWNYEADVDVKNPKSKNDNVKRDKSKKEKVVYAPK
ncbi:MAG TPA: hypothetical protein VNZ49_11640 [Bacteroidia bacterium]|jgi:hypothetical protein|nr:hypothetical protein [Bacteroidia bacterium]